jgi:transcriptional regulator with XRE-family HTH domain
MPEISQWLKQQLEQRSWSSSELARRAGLSQSSVSHVLTGRQVPGLEFCKGVAKALEMPPEEMLRLAGHLPPLAEPVAEEREALRLLRGLSGPMRGVALSLLRALDRGAGGQPGALEQPGAPGQARAARDVEPGPKPGSLTERLAFEIAQDLEAMPPDDQRRVLDLMKRLRGDQGAGERAHVPLEPET